MAVIGESCASLTPYGVGATLAQLGRGGLPNDKKPRRPVCIHGLGYTSAFDRPATGQSLSGETVVAKAFLDRVALDVLVHLGIIKTTFLVVPHAAPLVSSAVALGVGAFAQ
ncbi:unnamed protein product, partial [Symbiodinium natans]